MMLVFDIAGRSICAASVSTSYASYDVLRHGRPAASCTQLPANF